ncbi:hypothetical protein IEO21_10426 [Rhodonia placenta]|uniref:Uncharacterized protein n=1 Tax=Rhodonia placenta TaxID=104341 RepID=A0A8H7NSG2_9APHY|nr:hypothetical protein IEO21_10426 [Postia placenta]
MERSTRMEASRK